MSRKHRGTSRHRATVTRLSAAAPPPAAPVSVTESKVDPAFSGITIINDTPQPHSMPRNYKSYSKEGYGANDSVFKCVRYIVENGAAIPPKLYSDATMETEIADHPLLDFLRRPNPSQDGVTFRESVLGWYLITGNSFIYAIRESGAKNGPPDELWTLDPNKVHPLPHPTKGIIGYKFDDFEDGKDVIPAPLMGHLKTWNPNDPIFGLSPVEVGALMVDQQNAARKWNLALMQNMAKPSGAWTTEVALERNAREALEAKINEKLAGARNAGKTPVIDAGAKWVQTSLAPSEVDWLKTMQYNAGQLANLWNIPPQLIGDTSATTYDNMEQAKEASYTEAIFPTLDKLYSLLTMWLVPMWTDLAQSGPRGILLPKAYLYYDKTTVEVVQKAIQAREDAKATRAGQLYIQGVITLNQAQEMQGLPDLGSKGEVYRIGSVLVPADKLEEYAEQSLAEPAAPPMAVPEPLPGSDPNAPPAPTPPGQPGKEPTPPTPPAKPSTPPEPAPDDGKKSGGTGPKA